MSTQIQPAGLPPVGVSSNFADPVNRAPNLIACNIVLLVVSVLIVGARLLSRTILTDWRLGWDDCTSTFQAFSMKALLICGRYDYSGYGVSI